MDGLTETQTHDLTLDRFFKAPPALMFKVWTQADHLARWWGCDGSTIRQVKTDPKVGGKFRVEMDMEDGTRHVIMGVYRAVNPNDYLEFTWTWENENGEPGEETLVSISLAPKDEGTQLTLNHQRFVESDMRDAHGMGWGTGFDRLEKYLVDAA